MVLSHLLHSIAYVSVRLLPPIRAQRALARVAAALPQLNREQSTQALARLRGGSCLTRSMTVAARLPGASVVIGVPRPGYDFEAHAWVEHEGRALLVSDPKGAEIARFACLPPSEYPGSSPWKELVRCVK